jgi:hypothetical protein
MAVLLKCSNPSCLGKWQLHSEEILLKMRSRPRNENEEREALRCSLYGIRSSCTDRINAALEHGYLRCYKKSKPNKEEILNLIWLGLPKQPDSMDPIENDRWLLDVAVVHGLLNIHDWRHRASCFKNDRDRGRYPTPHATVNETRITPEFKAGNINKINIEICFHVSYGLQPDCFICAEL